jgi:hypothetical protein
MLRQLESTAWTRRGTVCDHPMTTRAMAYILAGHAQHHLAILQKRLAKP